MKKIYLVISLIVLGLFTTQQTKASHLMGMDIQYNHIFGETYQITFSLYRDCSGISADASVTVNISSPSGCGTAGSVTLTMVPGTGNEVSPLCASAVSTCEGGTIQGVEQYVYQGVYTFPSKCDDWEITYGSCCRNSVITTGPANDNYAIKATLDNTGTINNNSPQFTTLPVPYICVGQEFNYNHGAFDPDGDSLVFSLVDGLATPAGALVSYTPPYSATYPISDISGSILFDNQTGAMVVTPNIVQVAIIAIRVDEYRNGVLIGSIMRDIQVVVQNCSNVQPNEAGAGGITNSSGGILIDANSIEACPGDALSFDVVFEDANAGDSVILSSNLGTVIPGATFTSTGMNPVTGTITWTPTGNDAGFHNFVVRVQDNGCPILGTQVYSYDILVHTGTTAGPDVTYCPGGITPQLIASGGTTFNWSVLSGSPIVTSGGGANFTCNPCATPIATPASTTTYIVTSDLSAVCKNKDTVTVNVSSGFTVNMNPTSATICWGEQTQISANPTGGGTFSYSWAPSSSLTSGTIQNPMASPTTSTTYVATVTNNSTGCRVQNSVPVTISGVAPTVIISPSDTSICQGQSVNINASAFNLPATCGPNAGGCSTAQSYKTIGNGTSTNCSSCGPTPFGNYYYGNKTQYLYTAAELNAMGMTGGTITELAFNVSAVNSVPTLKNMEVRIGCVSQTDLSSAWATGLTSVYSSANYNVSTGWNTITFSTPYDWDGVSSLVVDICTNDIAYTSSGDASVYYTSTSPAYKTRYQRSDATTVCSSPGAGTSSYNRANIRFRSCELTGSFAYTWTPSTGLSNASIANPTATPATTTNYLLEVYDSGSGCTGFANTQFNVGPNFTLTTRPDTSICFGGKASMYSTPSGAGTYTYVWTPYGSLSNPFSATPDATPATTTSYSVLVDNGGCQKTGNVTVTVASQPISAIIDDSVLCPDQTGQLDVSFVSGCENYTAQSTTYSYVGGGSWLNEDDAEGDSYYSTSAMSIGFPFDFYCNTFTEIYASSNGYLSFNPLISSGYYSNSLPYNSSYAFNRISVADEDLVCTQARYKTIGTTPNQIFIFEYTGYQWSTAEAVEYQVKLFEVDNSIEVHLKTIGASASDNMSLGLNNGTGTIASVVDDGSIVRNEANWTATTEAWRFSYTLAGPYTYTWSPGTGLSDTKIQNPTVSGILSPATYQVIQVDQGSGGTCPSIGTVNVYPDLTNTLDAGPDLYSCATGNFNMNATVTGPIPAVGCNPYTGTAISYAAPPGGGWSADLNLGDDVVSSALNIGFDFDFYCNTYSQFWVSSNGWMTFTSTTSSNLTEQTLPSTSTPNNVIAFAWDDLYGSATAGSIVYKTVGTAPNRVCYIAYNGVPHCCAGTNPTVSGYIALYETSNIIEIHSLDIQDDADGMTQGIENSTGTEGMAVPGRNNGTPWTASNDAYRFTPGPVITAFNWTDGTFMDDSTAEDPVATIGAQGVYDFELSIVGQNCTLRDTIRVTIDNGDTLYWTGAVDQDWFNAGNWGGCYIPTCSKDVIIPGTASKMPIIAAAGAACRSIDIDPGASLTIDPGFGLDVCGDFRQLGSLSAAATSVIDFIGTGGVQVISGNVSGANSFGHLHVNKTATIEVDLTAPIDVKGDLIVTTGRFDCNSNYVKVAGDFLIYEIDGFNYKTGTLEFNGTAQQDFYINK